MQKTGRLTEELVRRAWREIPDTGPLEGFVHFTEEDYDDHLDEFLKDRPAGPVHVFAYGSLIWKPVFAPAGVARAIAPGWRRAFCLRLLRWRGTLDQPGLMMQLAHGEGSVEGVLQRLDPASEREDLRVLWRREMTVKPSGNAPRWIDTQANGKPVRAIAFTANPESPNYVGGLTLEETAQIIASACGHWGSCAEYLLSTITALEEHGIDDPYLRLLEERVAEHLERLG